MAVFLSALRRGGEACQGHPQTIWHSCYFGFLFHLRGHLPCRCLALEPACFLQHWQNTCYAWGRLCWMAGAIGLRIMLAFDWISPDAETSEGKTVNWRRGGRNNKGVVTLLGFVEALWNRLLNGSKRFHCCLQKKERKREREKQACATRVKIAMRIMSPEKVFIGTSGLGEASLWLYLDWFYFAHRIW